MAAFETFRFLLIFGLTITFSAYGQYPFEKFPGVKATEVETWRIDDECQTAKEVVYTASIPHFFHTKEAASVKLICRSDTSDTSYIRIYRGRQQIQSFTEPYSFGSGYECNRIVPNLPSMFAEDVNGDGLKDLKILIPGNAGCGAFNYYLQVIYLFQNRNGTFTKVSFSDLMMFYQNHIERDIDGDGNYEIITQTFQNVGKHNYWVFNLYDFTGKGLVNVNRKAHYPIMIQLLYRENYKGTDKIPRSIMKQYERKLPDTFDIR